MECLMLNGRKVSKINIFLLNDKVISIFLFILLWSSAFVTTKPIVDNSEPFSALALDF